MISILLKAVPAAQVLAATVMTLGPLNIQNNTNIVKNSKQSVKWYREIITQLTENQAALKQQLDKQGY